MLLKKMTLTVCTQPYCKRCAGLGFVFRPLVHKTINYAVCPRCSGHGVERKKYNLKPADK